VKSWLLAWVAVVGAFAQAQTDAPLNAGIRAAYCIAAVKMRVKVVEDLRSQVREPLDEQERMASQTLERAWILADRDLRRLQTYLDQRMPVLEDAGLVAAALRGEADVQSLSALTQSCGVLCRPRFTSGAVDTFSACFSDCLGAEAAPRRLARCDSTYWVPR
jgi:hypothetical protein